MDVQSVSLSTICSVDVHWVSLSLPPTTAFLYAGMSDCPASSQSGTRTIKNSLCRKPVRYRNRGTQSGTGVLRYRTEIQDAGMPMPSYGLPKPFLAPSNLLCPPMYPTPYFTKSRPDIISPHWTQSLLSQRVLFKQTYFPIIKLGPQNTHPSHISPNL